MISGRLFFTTSLQDNIDTAGGLRIRSFPSISICGTMHDLARRLVRSWEEELDSQSSTSLVPPYQTHLDRFISFGNTIAYARVPYEDRALEYAPVDTDNPFLTPGQVYDAGRWDRRPKAYAQAPREDQMSATPDIYFENYNTGRARQQGPQATNLLKRYPDSGTDDSRSAMSERTQSQARSDDIFEDPAIRSRAVTPNEGLVDTEQEEVSSTRLSSSKYSSMRSTVRPRNATLKRTQPQARCPDILGEPAIRSRAAIPNEVLVDTKQADVSSTRFSPSKDLSIRSTVRPGNATVERTHPRCPDVFSEPTVSGRLQGADVSAFPDTGAAANYLSLPYTQLHGLAINKSARKSVKVGDGSMISVIGTTILPFSFAGELTRHNLTFHVLRNSVHDIILGSTFLRATETFTRFAHRVGRKIRRSVSHRICYLGSQQYVNGQASGVGVDAVPDTGADVSVMSTQFAVANGFEVDYDEQHRILLEFADGSTARAQGVVMDVAWEFGADENTSPTDVYVLSSLPVDLVLGFGFLCQTEAFQEHWHNFWHIEEPEQDDVGMFCVIRVLKDAGDDISCEYRCSVTSIWRLHI